MELSYTQQMFESRSNAPYRRDSLKMRSLSIFQYLERAQLCSGRYKSVILFRREMRMRRTITHTRISLKRRLRPHKNYINTLTHLLFSVDIEIYTFLRHRHQSRTYKQALNSFIPNLRYSQCDDDCGYKRTLSNSHTNTSSN